MHVKSNETCRTASNWQAETAVSKGFSFRIILNRSVAIDSALL